MRPWGLDKTVIDKALIGREVDVKAPERAPFEGPRKVDFKALEWVDFEAMERA